MFAESNPTAFVLRRLGALKVKAKKRKREK